MTSLPMYLGLKQKSKEVEVYDRSMAVVFDRHLTVSCIQSIINTSVL